MEVYSSSPNPCQLFLWPHLSTDTGSSWSLIFWFPCETQSSSNAKDQSKTKHKTLTQIIHEGSFKWRLEDVEKGFCMEARQTDFSYRKDFPVPKRSLWLPPDSSPHSYTFFCRAECHLLLMFLLATMPRSSSSSF